MSPPPAAPTAAEAEPLIKTGTDKNDIPVSVLSLRGKPEPRVTTRAARDLIAKGLARVENERGPRLRTIRLLVESSALSEAIEFCNGIRRVDAPVTPGSFGIHRERGYVFQHRETWDHLAAPSRLNADGPENGTPVVYVRPEGFVPLVSTTPMPKPNAKTHFQEAAYDDTGSDD